MEFKSAHDAPCLSRREGFVMTQCIHPVTNELGRDDWVEAAGRMGVQVVQYYPNAFCFRIQLVYHIAHPVPNELGRYAESKVELGAPLGHFDMPLASVRLEEYEQITSAIPFVLVVVALRLARLSGQRYTCFTEELLRHFVKADHGSAGVMRFGVPRPAGAGQI